MNFELTEIPPLYSDYQVVFERKCSQFLCTPAASKCKETMQKDIAQWYTYFSDLPHFATLDTEQLAKVKTFVTTGIRLAYLTFSDIEIVVNNDFDTLSMSLQAGSFLLYQNALECLSELDRLSDHIIINAFSIDQRSLGVLIMIPLIELLQ